jgi:tellurite resistance protein
MNHTEAEARLRVLCAVASADGEVDGTERQALALLGSGDAGRPDGVVDVDREARRIGSLEARRATFEAAVAIASVDGQCTTDEHQLLERLRAALDLPDSFDLAVAEGEWGERLRPHRAELADADADFLRQIAAQVRLGALKTAEYTALVGGLRTRRDAILREALAPVLTA